MAKKISLFKTPAGEAEYLAAYEATMKHWPLPYLERQLETRFGTVHAILSGESDAPPLLLLHGTHTSSTVWLPNVRSLGRRFRLVALDLLGHAGKSRPARGINNADEAAAWIVEALDQLQIAQAHVLGFSMGTCFALNLALRAPDRVSRVAICGPAGAFGLIGTGLLLRLITMALFPSRWVTRRFLRWASRHPAAIDPSWQEQYIQAIRHVCFTNPAFYLPWPLTDLELAQISVPVLILLGEEEVMFNQRRQVKRALTHLRDVEVDVIPKAGHFFIAEQPDQANRRLLSFLDWPLPAVRAR
ncbi:MAG: alpha/beta fold hydrolase [Bacillota bacterium]